MRLKDPTFKELKSPAGRQKASFRPVNTPTSKMLNSLQSSTLNIAVTIP
jgi:hypothetical protein